MIKWKKHNNIDGSVTGSIAGNFVCGIYKYADKEGYYVFIPFAATDLKPHVLTIDEGKALFREWLGKYIDILKEAYDG